MRRARDQESFDDEESSGEAGTKPFSTTTTYSFCLLNYSLLLCANSQSTLLSDLIIDQLWQCECQTRILYYSIPISKGVDCFRARLDHIRNLLPAAFNRYGMGFWSSPVPSSIPAAPKISTDGTPIAPNRSERSKCWEARDTYFRCLDTNDIVDSIKEGDKAAKVCAAEGKGFETNCATSWVC